MTMIIKFIRLVKTGAIPVGSLCPPYLMANVQGSPDVKLYPSLKIHVLAVTAS